MYFLNCAYNCENNIHMNVCCFSLMSFTAHKNIKHNKKNKVKPSRIGFNLNHKEPHSTTEDKTCEESGNNREGFTKVDAAKYAVCYVWAGLM